MTASLVKSVGRIATTIRSSHVRCATKAFIFIALSQSSLRYRKEVGTATSVLNV